jgi:hypothetical protein
MARFHDKQIIGAHGFAPNSDGAAAYFEGSNLIVAGGLQIEGAFTATMLLAGSARFAKTAVTDLTGTTAVFNVSTVGSATITNALLGKVTGTAAVVDSVGFKTSAAITNMWGFVYTADFGALGAVGSLTAVSVIDVAASGVLVGDFAVANPVGSMDTQIFVGAAVSSAANIQLRAHSVGSAGGDPGAIPFKIFVIR